MRFLFHLLSMIVVALVVGFGLSYYALNDGRLIGAVRVGPWSAWPGSGSSSPDPYTRAYIARTGALQLGQGEGITFTATGDNEGRPLDRSCRYRIAGTTPVASFWTLRATDAQGGDIARPDGQQALRSRNVARANDGSLVLYVSRSLAPDNWLEITGKGPFELVLTLYDPSNLSGVGVAVQSLPAIFREACGA
ncbi:MAG TPA: DUF1214 domain-containing protein [Devosiaceae bacterium]|nr:DUF1214 domain-containing protein [Devosiaceae bacterium]